MVKLEVVAVCGELCHAVLSDGQVIEVTHWFSAGGCSCGQDGPAVSCVAGPDAAGRWWSIDLTEFSESATVH